MLAQSGFDALQSQHFSLPGILTSTSNVLNNKINLIKQELNIACNKTKLAIT